MSHEKIYKYASIDTALMILSNDKLLLRNPVLFNDPFDTNVKRNKDDIDRVRKLTIAFTSVGLLISLLEDPNIGDKVKKHPLFKAAKLEYHGLIAALKAHPYFEGNIAFNTLYKIIGLKSTAFKEKALETQNKFEQVIDESLKISKDNLLVTCFSKTNKSILMWSHYADSHTGVCIEYERPDSQDFLDITYSKKRPTLKLYDLISHVFAEIILNNKDTQLSDTELAKEVIKPFLVKSTEWKYEEEVRCIVTKNAKSKHVQNKNDAFYYLMPKPTKVYIGCRAKGEKRDELIKFLKKRNIKYVFLKEDKDNFSLVEK